MSILILILSFSRLWLPHGDLHLRINDLSQIITAHPDSLDLYIIRGDLYIQHEEYKLAEQDFQFCLSHGSASALVLEGLSKSLGYQNRLDSSLQLIESALEKDSASLSALEWKARISYLMKRYCDAGSLYEQLINSVENPSPSLFLDASNAWDQCNSPIGQQRVIEILLEGVQRIGPLHVFYRELSRKSALRHEFKNAIGYQTLLIEKSINKSPSLFERALLFEQAGNMEAAIADLQQAIYMLDELPAHKSSVAGMQQLRADIESTLKRIQN